MKSRVATFAVIAIAGLLLTTPIAETKITLPREPTNSGPSAIVTASATLAAPAAPRIAPRTPLQRTPNRLPQPARITDGSGPTACSIVSDRARLAPLLAHSSLVSSFASFLNLNSQSLQILSPLFHPVAQYLLLRFHLIRDD